MSAWLSRDSDGNMRVNSICAVIAMRLNASQRCRVGVGMNRSARGFELSVGLDAALCKNTPLPFISSQSIPAFIYLIHHRLTKQMYAVLNFCITVVTGIN